VNPVLEGPVNDGFHLERRKQNFYITEPSSGEMPYESSSILLHMSAALVARHTRSILLRGTAYMNGRCGDHGYSEYSCINICILRSTE
jgi:hypothetical protein